MSEPEIQTAVRIANAVLDKPYEDPDSDISILARQLLRALEREQEQHEPDVDVRFYDDQ